MMKSIALFSGGKDSFYAVQKVLKDGTLDLLVSIYAPNGDTQLHAGPEGIKSIREAQLEAIGLSFRQINIGYGQDYLHGLFISLKKVVDEVGVGYLITGDLWHPYTSGIGDMLAGALGVTLVRPAREVCSSREKAILYMKEVIDSGIESIVLSVRKDNLPEEFVGRQIDNAFFEELDGMQIDPAGEGGEYQSLTVSAPIMSKKIVIDIYDRQLVDGKNKREQFYRMNIKKFHTEKR